MCIELYKNKKMTTL